MSDLNSQKKPSDVTLDFMVIITYHEIWSEKNFSSNDYIDYKKYPQIFDKKTYIFIIYIEIISKNHIYSIRF